MDVDGLRGISSVNTVCWDVTENLQDLEGKYRELTISQKARGCSQDVEEKSRELANCHRIHGIVVDRYAKNYNIRNCTATISVLL